MKASIPLLALLVATAFLPAAAGVDAVETITVTLQISVGIPSAPLLKACEVTLPEKSNAADALDQAVADECLREWTSGSFPGLGRYVVSIDHVSVTAVTFWAHYLNGEFGNSGIDTTYLLDGDVLLFNYQEWLVPVS